MAEPDSLLLGDIVLPSASRHRRIVAPFSLDTVDLLTHVFVCGATGSGKTVLGKAIVEEAAVQGIPALIVDLKGDLSSLALPGAPLLSGRADGLAPFLGDEVQDNVTRFREATESEPGYAARCHRFAERVAVEVYTPKSVLGRPIALASFPYFDKRRDECDPQEREDYEQLLHAFVDSFLARLTGTDRPTDKSRNERTFLVTLLNDAWERGESYEGEAGLERLVQQVFAPGFKRVGALPVDLHLNETARAKLARTINNQLVGMERSWFAGEPFDLSRMLTRQDGRTPVIVLNVSHLDAFSDRAFVVAQACYAIHRWMRRQGGSSKPRLLFFLDEIGAAGMRESFYPSHPYNPPSKGPLNLVLRQGRAFGVCCLLATQNVIGIDHQGLANCQTWIVGPLNSGKERARVQESIGQDSTSALTRELASLQHGEFVARTKNGETQRFHERCLYSVHRLLDPAQVQLLTRHGAPPTSSLSGPVTAPQVRSATDQPRPPRPSASELIRAAHEARARDPKWDDTLRNVEPFDEETRTVAPRSSWTVGGAEGACLTMTVGHTYTIGRHPDCDLVIANPTVSRRHLELDVTTFGVHLRTDASVKNRPLVDGRELPFHETLLVTKSAVGLTLGDVTLLLELVPGGLK